MTPEQRLLRNLVADYRILQRTEGARTPIDAQGIYTAGHWLGSRMEGTIIEAEHTLEGAGVALITLDD